MSSSSSHQEANQQFTDNRLVQGQGALYANNGATLNSYTLDGGAIQNSFDAINNVVGKSYDFGQSALDFSSDTASQALSLVGTGVGRVLDATANTQQLVADAYNDAKGRGAMTDKILIAAVAGALLVAFAAVKHKA